MIIKKENVTFVPPIRQNENGWLNINGKIIRITNIHHFDDFGQTIDTLTLEDGQEVYSLDEGETFTFDLD
tara:strand:+ start:427 stop:636 length:210 start_codon:yes stop_codon:yes gene_type:complete